MMAGDHGTSAFSASSSPAQERGLTIHQRFDHWVKLQPSKLAICASRWEPTYSELKQRADGLAASIRSHRGGVGDRVCLLMAHDAPLVATMLAVLKAGRIVVVLNRSDPPARLEQVLDDAEPSLIITDSPNREVAERIAGLNQDVLIFEDWNSGTSMESAEIEVSPDAVAFLVYTSGSTGRPKGVMRTHNDVIHQVVRLTFGLGFSANDRVALLASPSGGQGMMTTWSALLNGAALCPFPVVEIGVTGLADWMLRNKITVYSSSASLFRHFMKTLDSGMQFPDMRLVRLASESATSSDFARFREHFSATCILAPTLSSSETGNICLLHLTREDTVSEGRLPVGLPAHGVEVMLLNESGNEVAPGEAGEITVKSRHSALGYWRNEELTAQRFLRDESTDGATIFRSGDIGRRDTNGHIMVVGRSDERVKVRGYRIELTEIEDTLQALDDVDRAVVMGYTSRNETMRLIAFIELSEGGTCTADSLREWLRALLPRHMIPTFFEFVDRMPLTPHGKIDREKLRDRAALISPSPCVTDLRTATEVALAGIWCEVLEHDRVGGESDFFDLGGDSLLGAVIAAKVHAAFQVELSLQAFFDHPKLAGLARAIDELTENRGEPDLPPLIPVSRDQPLPLSLLQERIWRYSATPESSAGYVKASSLTVSGPLDVEAFRWSLEQVIARHEALRTSFEERNGGPVQVIHPRGKVDLPFIDFSRETDPESASVNWLREKSREPIDLTTPPLLRFWLIRIGKDQHRFLRVHHNIISDGLSWVIFFRDLGLFYEARRSDRNPPELKNPALHYADFATWQRRCLQPGTRLYQEHLDWWEQRMQPPLPPLELPFIRPAPEPDASVADGLVSWGLEAGIAHALETLARENGTTFYMIRLAAFAALLLNESGHDEIIIGTHVTNRNRVELQDMFGFFLNMVPLRLRYSKNKTFKEWLHYLKMAVAETQSYSAIPYDELCDKLRRREIVPPVIQVIFGLSGHMPAMYFGGLEIEAGDRTSETMPWGFSLSFDLQHEESFCRATFDARIYDPEGVREFIARLLQVLDVASRQPDCSLSLLLAKAEPA